MNILMTKFASNRNENYRLITSIYEESDQLIVSKSITSKCALKHLHSFEKKYHKLKSSIKNPKLKVNKIFKKNDSIFLFEYIQGSPFEDLIYQALSEHNTQKLKNLLTEFCTILKTSFNLKNYNEIKEDIPNSLKNLYQNNSLGYFEAGIPFDLTPGNIFIKESDNSYEIIDYEWTVSFPLSVEFVIYRALHCCALQYNAEIFQKNIDIQNYSGEMTFEIFSKIENVIMNEIQPYKKKIQEPNNIDINKTKEDEYPPILFSQLYFNYGNGYTEEHSILENISEPMDSNNFIFSCNDIKDRNFNEIRFDPLNLPCSLKLNKIAFIKDEKEIFLYTEKYSNGINDELDIFYFATYDPQFYIKNVPQDILNKFDSIKIFVEFIAFGSSIIGSFNSIAKNILDSQSSKIATTQNSLQNITATLEETYNTINKHILEKNSLQKSLKNSQEQIETQKTLIQNLEKRLNSKHLEITTLNLKKEDLNSKINIAKQNNKQLISLLDNKNILIKDLKEQIENLKNNIITINEQTNLLKEKHSEELIEKQKEIQQQISDYSKLQELIKELKNQIAALQHTNNGLENQLIERDIILLKFQKSLREYKKSRSWRMTAPYRSLDAFIAKLLKGAKNG
jgi:hypothetical protein